MFAKIGKKELEELRTKTENHDCSVCTKHKTMDCPNSSLCYATEAKPEFNGWVKYLDQYLKARGK